MIIEISALARAEFLEAVAQCRSIDPDLASHFVDAVERSFDRLARHPRSGAPIAGSAGLRRSRVVGFPHLVIARTRGGSVLVVGLFHPARDPGQLEGR